MMAQKKETAEQKLLKMIEASSAGGGASAVSKGKKVFEKQSALSLLQFSNKILILGLVAVVAYLVFELNEGVRLNAQGVLGSGAEQMAQSSTTDEELIPAVEKISFYLFGVQQRNIFKPFEAVATAAVDSSQKGKMISQRIRNLKLVGVSWMDNVDTASAMIEDADKGITYFLQKGEKIGDISVKTIYAESVALGYKNEEIIIGYEGNN